KFEKESLIIKLLEEGWTVREIAKEAHASPETIGEIKRMISGESASYTKKNKKLSKNAMALKLFSENKNLTEVSFLIKTIEVNSSNGITLVPQDEESAKDMDKLILISKRLGSIDTIDNIHHDDSNEIIREKIINRFEDRSYFSYFEKVYVAFGNTSIYNIIIRGLLKSLVTLNYFQQSENVFYKGL
ncbi:MAG TPA: helix-turn-helix domain-containing protein, partial [Nitrososphaeraceae archaeon]|nr:helix-turn-helix domain-containing protein [Nitrososphaeraceae archaeon]